MRKLIGPFVLIVVVLLSACAPSSSAPVAPAPTAAPQPTLGPEQQKCLNNPTLGSGSKDQCMVSEAAAKAVNDSLVPSGSFKPEPTKTAAAPQPAATEPTQAPAPTEAPDDTVCGHVNDSDGTAWGEILALGANNTYAAVQNNLGGAEYGYPYEFSTGKYGSKIPDNAKVCVGSDKERVIAKVQE